MAERERVVSTVLEGAAVRHGREQSGRLADIYIGGCVYRKADVTSSLARLTATNPVGVPSATEEDPRTQGRFG